MEAVREDALSCSLAGLQESRLPSDADVAVFVVLFRIALPLPVNLGVPRR